MLKITKELVAKQKDNIPYKEIEDEGILLNLENGEYFSLNEVGLFIWKLLNGAKNLERVAQHVSACYKVNKQLALNDLLKFIKVLYAKRLLTILTQRQGRD